MCKNGQATWKFSRNMEFRDTTRKAKTHLQLSLVRDIKKGFYDFISSKRKIRQNAGPLQNQMGVLVMDDTEKVKLLNAFFACLYY